MDPQTVVVVLALNLIAVGVLLVLIARRIDAGADAGMRGFAVGSIVFGLAYLLRLAIGHQSTSPVGVVADVCMVGAALAYGTGLRQFSGRAPLRAWVIGGWLVAFAALSVVCTGLWQGVGRHAVLNLGLALCYLGLAALALAGRRRGAATLKMPLTVLAVLTSLLGLFTAVRGVAVVLVGLPPLFQGLPAQLYYGYATLVTVVLGPNLLWMVFVRLNDRLARLATHDPLTGLLNRNGLEEALQRHFGLRPPRPLVLCQVDIDHFKHINDGHGHAAGDRVLQGVAQVLAEQVRGGDFIARLGGEEFLVGCDSGSPSQAEALAERLRQAVAARQHALPDGGTLACTVSIGVSPVVGDRTAWEAALRRADAALYAAKQAGRNRVKVHEAEVPAAAAVPA